MKSLTRLIAAVAAGALVLSATAVEAAPGIVRTTAAVYAKASTTSKIVATLHKGDYVIVKSCTLHWCKVHNVKLDGYVQRTQLYHPRYGSRTFYQFPPANPDPSRIHPAG
ncbi:MAG: SH3 domain-containing protein [Devosia sp.]